MRFKNYLDNLINKAPKIAMFIVVLFVLGHSKSSYFGIVPAKNVPKIEIPIEFLCQHYGAKVEITTDDGIYYSVNAVDGGQKLGAVLSSVNFSDKSKGYGGRTPLIIMLDSGDVITGVKLLANNETSKFVKRVINAGFFNQWNGKHITDIKFIPDAVSGATMTSNSVMANVDATIGAFVSSHAVEGKGFKDYLGSFAVIAIVALAFASYLFPAKFQSFRLVLLVGSIAVLGVWQGAFVSVQLLYNWVINGTNWLYFAVIAVVALAIFIPLLTNKSFYCQYLCPFGAAQELASKFVKNRIKIPKSILRIFRYIRQFALIGIVALLLVNPNFEPSTIEPFSVFMVRSATISVILIAGISLFASIFINRPWCRLMCPTGEILSLLQRKIDYKRKK